MTRPPRRRNRDLGDGEGEDLFGKTPFVDLMMSTLCVVTALLFAAIAVERAEKVEKKQEASIETDGLYAIVADWPKDFNDDVDLYVQDPAGNLVFYSRPTAELMHLEYDDRGDLGDTAMTSSGQVKAEINRERIIIRGPIAGEYVVWVQMFAKHHPAPTTVKVSLYRLKGDDTEILARERTLRAAGDDETAFRFTLAPDGEKTGDSDLHKDFPGAQAQTQGSAGPQGGMSFPGGMP